MPESLTDQLKVLIELQQIDSRIYDLKQNLEEFPERQKSIQASLDTHKEAVKIEEEALKLLQAKQKELENDMLSKEEAVKKFQSQQSQVKTNQEYTALTHEIKNAEADISVLEDETLALMDKVDGQKRQLGEEKKNLVTEEEKVKAEIKKLDGEIAAIKQEIEKMSGDRKNFVEQVDPELLSQYELVLTKRQGVAIVALSGESCSGCSMTLPPQVVAEVKNREKVISCESCGRLLYEA